jgi:hypothetical protein
LTVSKINFFFAGEYTVLQLVQATITGSLLRKSGVKQIKKISSTTGGYLY